MVERVVVYSTKNPGIAAILALVLGFFGFFGVGHIYVGRVRRGIILLVVGIILDFLIYPGIVAGMLYGGLGGLLAILVLLLVVDLILWIWQIMDSYRSAKYYNHYLIQYNEPPW